MSDHTTVERIVGSYLRGELSLDSAVSKLFGLLQSSDTTRADRLGDLRAQRERMRSETDFERVGALFAALEARLAGC